MLLVILQAEEVEIFTATLRLPDKTKLIIPNGQALEEPIPNYTEAVRSVVYLWVFLIMRISRTRSHINSHC